ncbi:MAG: FitA-like ribbon-helix-helix domain-containing protein [Vulcanimicrobiaceae bacterium]
MAELKVRNLDDRVASALRARAKKSGVSLEEEARRTLSHSVAARQHAFARRAAALRAAIGRPSTDSALDGAAIIRAERDASG